MKKRSPRFWNQWPTQGKYKGLSKTDKEYLGKFNKEWTGQSFGDEPLHNVKLRQQLAHSEYARRNDAMNVRYRIRNEEEEPNQKAKQKAINDSDATITLIDKHRSLQKRRHKLLLNEKTNRRFLNLDKETKDVRIPTKRSA